MFSLFIVGALGAALGWFRVAVLFVAVFSMLMVVGGLGAGVAGLWWIALELFAVAFCLQIGFVAGSATETYFAFLRQQRTTTGTDRNFAPNSQMLSPPGAS